MENFSLEVDPFDFDLRWEVPTAEKKACWTFFLFIAIGIAGVWIIFNTIKKADVDPVDIE